MLEVSETGNGTSRATAIRYNTTLNHVKDYLSSKGISDIPLPEINLKFITEFEHYLKTVRNCKNNTAVKYVKNLRKIIGIAYRNEWISKDPFVNYRAKLDHVERDFLTQDELDRIIQKEIHNTRLDQIRDVFVFGCYTGLRFSDISQLTPDHISVDIKGNKCILQKTQKSGKQVMIPLLSVPLSIIDRYKQAPECVNKNRLLPVISNQKTNDHLKVLADITGIKKNLTFHISRHTFATTVTLSNGVPIETVKDMLGHAKMDTTLIYAKITKEKVTDDMEELRFKLNKGKIIGVNEKPKA